METVEDLPSPDENFLSYLLLRKRYKELTRSINEEYEYDILTLYDLMNKVYYYDAYFFQMPTQFFKDSVIAGHERFIDYRNNKAWNLRQETLYALAELFVVGLDKMIASYLFDLSEEELYFKK